MAFRVTLELPDDVLGDLDSSPEAFARELRIAAAAKWYELGRVSQGRAAELAGLSRSEFISALGRFGVSPIQVTPEELIQEVERG